MTSTGNLAILHLMSARSLCIEDWLRVWMCCMGGRISVRAVLTGRSIEPPFTSPIPLLRINYIASIPISLVRSLIQSMDARTSSSSLMSSRRSCGFISWQGRVRCLRGSRSGRLWLRSKQNGACRNFNRTMGGNIWVLISGHISSQRGLSIRPVQHTHLSRMARLSGVSGLFLSVPFQCSVLRIFQMGSGRMLLRQQSISSTGVLALVSSGGLQRRHGQELNRTSLISVFLVVLPMSLSRRSCVLGNLLTESGDALSLGTAPHGRPGGSGTLRNIRSLSQGMLYSMSVFSAVVTHYLQLTSQRLSPCID